MSRVRVVGVLVSGFTLAACSGSALDFLKSSSATTALRFESVPPGAEVKVSGQTCRTPCELKLEVAELSATFALKGYQPETVAVHSDGSRFSAPQFTPNPVHAELKPVPAAARRQQKHEKPVATTNPRGGVSAEVTTSSEATPSSTVPPSFNVPPTTSTYGVVQ